MDTLRRKAKPKKPDGDATEQKTVINPLMSAAAKNSPKTPLQGQSEGTRARSGSLIVVSPSAQHQSQHSSQGTPLSERSNSGSAAATGSNSKASKETVRSNPIFQYYHDIINSSHNSKKVWNEEEKEKEAEPELTVTEKRRSKLGVISSKSEPQLTQDHDGEDETKEASTEKIPKRNKQRDSITRNDPGVPTRSRSDMDLVGSPSDSMTDSGSSSEKIKTRKKKKKKKSSHKKRDGRQDQRLSIAVEEMRRRDKDAEIVQPPLRRACSCEDVATLLSDSGFVEKTRKAFSRFNHLSATRSPSPSPSQSTDDTLSSAASPNPSATASPNSIPALHMDKGHTFPTAEGTPGTPRLRRVLSESNLKENGTNNTTTWIASPSPLARYERRSANMPGLSNSSPRSMRIRSASVCIGRGPTAPAPPRSVSPSSSPSESPTLSRSALSRSNDNNPTPAPSSSRPLSEEEQLQFTEKDGRKVVTCGTFDKLVMCLIGSQSDPDYIYSFLLSHTYFSDSVTLLNKLRERFFFVDQEPGEGDEKGKMITQLRIINVLKKWVENHYCFFKADEQLTETFYRFLDGMSDESAQQKEWAAVLRKSIEEKPKEEVENTSSILIDVKDEKLRPYLPKNLQSSQLAFMDMHPLEVARQITLLDHAIFTKINPTELYRTAWAKGDKSKAPNVIELTERFNKVCFWVATEIISTKTVKMRAEVLTRFIQLAMYLRSMNNFHGVMQIYASLNLGCVQRLKSSWKEVDKKEITRLKEIEAMFDPTSNYKNYRERLEAVSPPIVPFQAVYLADLTFIEEIPSFLENGLINFEKMRLLGKVISEIERYQKCPYSFFLVPPIEDFFKNNLTCLSEKELYDLAKANEQEAKEERGMGGVSTLRRGMDSSALGTLRLDKQRKKEIKELEKQEKKLMRSISFRSQSKNNRVRAATFT